MAQRLYLRQIEVGPMENYVYLVGDPETRQCVMVDPAWEVDRVVQAALADDMTLIGGLVTHTHFDHCNGAEDLISRTKSKIYVHKSEASFLKGMKEYIVPVDSEDTLKIGSLSVRFLHTPGHTPGSQCFLVQNHLVSGDTLFINACGRCDLPGGSAEQLYTSLDRLKKLDDDTVLLPGHNYADRPTSTIGQEKQQNPYLQFQSLKEFVNGRMK